MTLNPVMAGRAGHNHSWVCDVLSVGKLTVGTGLRSEVYIVWEIDSWYRLRFAMYIVWEIDSWYRLRFVMYLVGW